MIGYHLGMPLLAQIPYFIEIGPWLLRKRVPSNQSGKYDRVPSWNAIVGSDTIFHRNRSMVAKETRPYGILFIPS